MASESEQIQRPLEFPPRFHFIKGLIGGSMCHVEHQRWQSERSSSPKERQPLNNGPTKSKEVLKDRSRIEEKPTRSRLLVFSLHQRLDRGSVCHVEHQRWQSARRSNPKKAITAKFRIVKELESFDRWLQNKSKANAVSNLRPTFIYSKA